MNDIQDRYDAGRARVARAARGAGLAAAALDVLFHSFPQVFDITSASGFALLGRGLLSDHVFTFPTHSFQLRLALLVILEGKYGHVLSMMGVCCSSWVAISRGSSHRSFINPQGYSGYRAVNVANKMAARSWVLGCHETLSFCACLYERFVCLEGNPNLKAASSHTRKQWHVILPEMLSQDDTLTPPHRGLQWGLADRAAEILATV